MTGIRSVTLNSDTLMLPLLRINHLSIDFSTDAGITHALKDINITVNRGEIMALVGESGCGKTTAGKALLNLVPASGGSARYGDHELLALSPRQWQPLLDARIAALTRLRDQLASCIGCGCLSLQRCSLYNPDDTAARRGSGARYLLGDKPAA